MENDELNQLIKAARGAAFFIKSVDGYENSKTANQLLTLADKVEKQKLLAIGRLAARVVYRNAKKAVEHSVQRTADGLCECENLTFVDNPAVCPVCEKRRR